MISIFIKLLEEEGLRTAIMFGFMALCFYIIYHIFFKKYVEDFKKMIETFTVVMNANNEATKTVIFYELTREYYEKKKAGGKSVNADERFQRMWTVYDKLGDGNGKTLLNEWNSLPII